MSSFLPLPIHVEEPGSEDQTFSSPVRYFMNILVKTLLKLKVYLVKVKQNILSSWYGQFRIFCNRFSLFLIWSANPLSKSIKSFAVCQEKLHIFPEEVQKRIIFPLWTR